jgi:hypothetical protein
MAQHQHHAYFLFRGDGLLRGQDEYEILDEQGNYNRD